MWTDAVYTLSAYFHVRFVPISTFQLLNTVLVDSLRFA